MKKTSTFSVLALSSAIAMAFSGFSGAAFGADAAKAPSAFKPGTYSATVNGHNAPMTVKVTVSKDRIEKIDASANLETIGVGRVACDSERARQVAGRKGGRPLVHYDYLYMD